MNHHVVALAGPGANQAGGHRAHGAVDRAEQIVVQLVGNAEEGMARRQIQEVGVGAGEVGPGSGGGVVAVHAPVGVAPETLVAVVAGKHGGVHHPVALLDGRASGVGGYPVAQGLDDAGALVSHGPSGGRQRHVDLVAAPDVQVGAADAGLGHAQQHRAGGRFGDVVFLDGEGLAVFLAGNNSAFHSVLLMVGVRWNAI